MNTQAVVVPDFPPPTQRGTATLSPRDQLAKDARDLRNFGVPNKQVQKVIELNKEEVSGNEQMTREEFVDAVRLQAMDAAVRTTVQTLVQPVERRPSEESVNVSNWYRTLTPDDRTHIETVVRRAAFNAVFGVLAILDGVRPVEGAGEKGTFELTYEKQSTRILLNDPTQELLHDMFAHRMWGEWDGRDRP